MSESASKFFHKRVSVSASNIDDRANALGPNYNNIYCNQKGGSSLLKCSATRVNIHCDICFDFPWYDHMITGDALG